MQVSRWILDSLQKMHNCNALDSRLYLNCIVNVLFMIPLTIEIVSRCVRAYLINVNFWTVTDTV